MSCAAGDREPRYMFRGTTTTRSKRSRNTARRADAPTRYLSLGEMQMGLDKRLSRLEREAVRDEVGDERKREKERADALHMARCANGEGRRDGLEDIFEITEDGEVYNAHDGRPVVTGHQALCERFYWSELWWGDRGFIHDEGAQEFRTPDGEPVVSRTYVHLPRLFRRV